MSLERERDYTELTLSNENGTYSIRRNKIEMNIDDHIDGHQSRHSSNKPGQQRLVAGHVLRNARFR